MAFRKTNSKNPSVSDGHARSVVGNQVGFSEDSDGTTDTVDLSLWQGRYVTIQAETADHYVAWGATAGTIDVDDATAGTALVGRLLPAGGEHSCIVPPGAPVFHWRTTTGTGRVRVLVE